MVLAERDREKVRLGRCAERIAQVRAFRHEFQPEQLAKFVFVTPELLKAILDAIDAHPDWDDEQVAENVDFD